MQVADLHRFHPKLRLQLLVQMLNRQSRGLAHRIGRPTARRWKALRAEGIKVNDVRYEGSKGALAYKQYLVNRIVALQAHIKAEGAA